MTRLCPLTLGVAERQGNLLDDMSEFCDRALAKVSIYVFLHRERDRLLPDDAFADLFAENGRRSLALRRRRRQIISYKPDGPGRRGLKKVL